MGISMALHTKPQLLHLQWSRHDGHRWVTWLAAAGATIAVAMAIFGLPAIDLHPPIHRLGIMDPLCGGTRAARYAAQGRLAEAWRYNPLGIVTVYGAALALARAAFGLISGWWLNAVVAWSPRRRRTAWLIALVLFAALEVRQQMRADLLIASP